MRKKQKLITVLLVGMLISSGIITNVLSEDTISDRSTPVYTVHRIEPDGSFSSTVDNFSTNNFNDAQKKMNDYANSQDNKNIVVRSTTSRSDTKIVSAFRARAQAYPYRKSTILGTDGAKTLGIYYDNQLKSRYTYVPAHYELFYYQTVLVNGKLVAEVEVNGARGFVDLDQIDIVPLFYYETKKEIMLGGNEDYYAKNGSDAEQPYKKIVSLTHYKVVYDASAKTNDLSVVVTTSHKSSSTTGASTTFAIAPSWLPPGTYYSANGINYYYDIELKQPVNNGASFYAYYVWLPVRSMSNITADDLNNYLVNRLGYSSDKNNAKYSVIAGNEQLFIEYANKYGMNALMVFAQACLESTYGSSTYARERLNLFGWNAVDSNPNLATTFAGLDTALSSFMGTLFRGYFSINDWRYYGNSYGNKGSGVTPAYASDPYYGYKIASIAYFIDYRSGFKDYDAYQLGVITDNKPVDVKKSSSNSAANWYSTKTNRINQTFTILSEENGFIKTNLSMPTENGSVVDKDVEVDLTSVFGYISSNRITKLPKVTNYGTSVPQTRITLKSSEVNYMISTGDGTSLNMRSSWTTNSRIMTTIPDNAIVKSVGIASNGWVKVEYNGLRGYVSPDFVKQTESPIEVPTGMKGDLNGDSKIDSRDMMAIYRHIIGTVTISANDFYKADINGDGKIDSRDMMAVYRHIIGTVTIQ
ncbi:hypothetical protein AOC36_04205 [Erysipelothrix larvae]|uniref:Dockerin domain-containing protein n=1 Tax=Erysipelothrix larvae TaxID=1514105 RepID=A0A0X8GZC5_9FIRM|nr:glucosaminidase domain-containing protein [Erysipelothrix larvae]AMC93201.1 hypothetical protein AOC36_04205 [Erysipelothrix larvae]